MKYWRDNADRDADEVKVEAVVVGRDAEAMDNVERFAGKEFDKLYDKQKRKIAKLKEARKQHYAKLRLATATPQTIAWELPGSIDFKRTPDAPEYKKHLFLEEDGKFRADLATWEREILEQELKDKSVVGWLRNMDRKPWALEIPYDDGGVIKPTFPDLLIVRKDDDGYSV